MRDAWEWDVMEHIAQLRLTETVQIHPDSVKTLQKQLGFEGSQELIERAVFEISERLVVMERALDVWDFDRVRKIASGLVRISEQIGLALFSRIAADVVLCVDRKDSVAAVAVTRRLLRVSDASLYAAIGSPEPYT